MVSRYRLHFPLSQRAGPYSGAKQKNYWRNRRAKSAVSSASAASAQRSARLSNPSTGNSLSSSPSQQEEASDELLQSGPWLVPSIWTHFCRKQILILLMRHCKYNQIFPLSQNLLEKFSLGVITAERHNSTQVHTRLQQQLRMRKYKNKLLEMHV